MVATPAIAASLKVRRYVSSDIGQILELARRASIDARVPFRAERLKFILDNNVKNLLIGIFVLVELSDIVGVLIVQMRKSVMNDDMMAYDEIFHLAPGYQDGINLIYHEYKDWARERGCSEIKMSNLYMPGMDIEYGSKFSVVREIL